MATSYPDITTATATTASHSLCRIALPDEKENAANAPKDRLFSTLVSLLNNPYNSVDSSHPRSLHLQTQFWHLH
jgi:hypothetical protein